MWYFDVLIYVLAVLFAAAVSIPFSAMIARKRPLLVVLLPVLLLLISLVLHIIYWNSTGEEGFIYQTYGLYSLFAAGGALLGSCYIILIRVKYRI